MKLSWQDVTDDVSGRAGGVHPSASALSTAQYALRERSFPAHRSTHGPACHGVASVRSGRAETRRGKGWRVRQWDRTEPMSMVDKSGANEPPDEAMQALIGKQLRTLYDSVLVEPIPDKIVELLIKLDDLSAGRRNGARRPATDQSTEAK
jgi:hypothetical protein